MKRGISLIVLVITIIVMIILAATIIISISNSNIINKANKAVSDTNIATIKEAAALKYADVTLAMKEAGNDSILGGKTVGEYIEQQLINDGTMKKSDPVIFTPKGGVYGPNEYNSIPDRTEVSDWRYIGNKLYYVGTDVDKRLALKNNPDVSVEYMLIDSSYNTVDEGELSVYTISSVGLSGKVTSYEELLEGDFFGNSERTLNNTVLASGTKLYSNGIDIGRVVIIGMVTLMEIRNDNSSFTVALSASDENYYANMINEDFVQGELISADNFSKIDPNLILELAADFDLDSDVDMNDYWLYAALVYQTNDIDYAEEKTVDQVLKLLGTTNYNNNKAMFEANFNMDKVITKLPMDLRK